MTNSPSFLRSFASLLAVGALLFVAVPAAASEEFPGTLEETLGMPCTPSCVVCHGKTPGDAMSFTARQLTISLIAAGSLPAPHDTAVLKTDILNYLNKATMGDAEAQRVINALRSGTDPQTGTALCGPTYGCAVHVAKKAPTRDVAAPLWVVGAMVVGGLLRRRKAVR